MNDKPFTHEILSEIFRLSSDDSQRIISRESNTVEFKESFGWLSLSDYLKTAASFANKRGGFIIFGISDAPHKLIGLSEPALSLFTGIDSERFTENLNGYFSPEITWLAHIHEIGSKTFGLLYFDECQDKPVVCVKNGGELKEGEIYYRYRAQSRRIKYPELRSIIDDEREKEKQSWVSQILRVAKIGISNTGIIDLKTGEVRGKSGSFLVDEELLKQISFIKEGEFDERRGKPTLKLIGNVSPINTLAIPKSKIITRTKIITSDDLVLCFLRQETVSDPKDYIKQICFGSIGYFPVYYYINKAGIDIPETISMIEGINSRSQAKNKLIKRLKNRTREFVEISNVNSVASIKKRSYKLEIMAGKTSSDLEGRELIYYLQAIRGLSRSEILGNKKILCHLLETSYKSHYRDPIAQVAGELRAAICWVDEALFMNNRG